MKSSDTDIRAISQKTPQPSTTKIHLKITYLKFHWNFPGANSKFSYPSSVTNAPWQHSDKTHEYHYRLENLYSVIMSGRLMRWFGRKRPHIVYECVFIFMYLPDVKRQAWWKFTAWQNNLRIIQYKDFDFRSSVILCVFLRCEQGKWANAEAFYLSHEYTTFN